MQKILNLILVLCVSSIEFCLNGVEQFVVNPKMNKFYYHSDLDDVSYGAKLNENSYNKEKEEALSDSVKELDKCCKTVKEAFKANSSLRATEKDCFNLMGLYLNEKYKKLEENNTILAYEDSNRKDIHYDFEKIEKMQKCMINTLGLPRGHETRSDQVSDSYYGCKAEVYPGIGFKAFFLEKLEKLKNKSTEYKA